MSLIYDVDFKMKATTPVVRLWEFIQDMKDEFDGAVNWDSIDCDENYVYFEIEFFGWSDYPEVEKWVKDLDYIEIDYEAMMDDYFQNDDEDEEYCCEDHSICEEMKE